MKVYLWKNFHEFHIYLRSKCFLYEYPLVCIYHKSTIVFFWIWWFFSWAVFHGFFWKQVSYRYGCSFTKSDRYLSSEVSLFSVPLFSSSEALPISDILWWSLFYFQKLFSAFWVYLITTVSLNAMTSIIRKRLRTFYFN